MLLPVFLFVDTSDANEIIAGRAVAAAVSAASGQDAAAVGAVRGLAFGAPFAWNRSSAQRLPSVDSRRHLPYPPARPHVWDRSTPQVFSWQPSPAGVAPGPAASSFVSCSSRARPPYRRGGHQLPSPHLLRSTREMWSGAWTWRQWRRSGEACQRSWCPWMGAPADVERVPCRHWIDTIPLITVATHPRLPRPGKEQGQLGNG